VIDKKPFSYFGSGMDLYTGHPAGELAHQARDKKKMQAIEKVRDAVTNEGMQALVKNKHLQEAFSRGILFLRCPYLPKEENADQEQFSYNQR